MATTEEIVTGLENAERNYKRDSSPGIYPFYLQFLETGNYPYLADVEKYILERVDVPAHLHKKLQTEVYIAARQHEREIKKKQEEQLLQDGFVQATQENLTEGKRYILSNSSQKEQREVKCVLHEGTFYFMPVRNRTKGFWVSGQWVKEVTAKSAVKGAK